MTTADELFMTFFEKEYGVKFIDAGEHPKATPQEPPPLPRAWVGMFSGWKRDAMYYEKCLKDIRDRWMQAKGMARGEVVEKEDAEKIIQMSERMISFLDDVLSHAYELDGVDLDKPNYGMFE